MMQVSHTEYCDINDLDVNVEGLVSRFAEKTKMDGAADSEEGCQSIKQDMNQLQK